MLQLPHGGRIVGQFDERMGRSGAGAVGSVAVRAFGSAPSPSEGAVSAATSAAAGFIFRSTIILVVQ